MQLSLELIDIAVRDKQVHPRLQGRITGHVRALLSEDDGAHSQTHDLTIAVWADLPQDANEADTDMALMVKAAGIIARLKRRLAGR
jgi:hypothetical protein